MAAEQGERLKVGAVAERLGVTVRTLRFYEQEGLLSAVRSAGGTRLYRTQDLARLRAIRDLAAAGVPLEQVRALASERAHHGTGAASAQAIDGVLTALAREADERVARLSALRDEIRRTRALLAGCRECARPPDSIHCPECPVRLARGDAPLASLIWDQAD